EGVYELNGTFFDILSAPDGDEPWGTKLDRFMCSQAVMLSLAGVPGIYVHSLFGSHTDHDGYARSGWKRDLNPERLPLAAPGGRRTSLARTRCSGFTRRDLGPSPARKRGMTAGGMLLRD